MLGRPGLPASWVTHIPLIAGSYQRQFKYFELLDHGYLALTVFRKDPETDRVEDEEMRKEIIGRRP